jgi:hypothetical protein
MGSTSSLIDFDGVRLRLLTAATNGHTVHSPDDELKSDGGMILTGENLSQCHFVYHKSHKDYLGANPDFRREMPATNRLSHGTARYIEYGQTKL